MHSAVIRVKRQLTRLQVKHQGITQVFDPFNFVIFESIRGGDHRFLRVFFFTISCRKQIVQAMISER